jgi:hypothetical protein
MSKCNVQGVIDKRLKLFLPLPPNQKDARSKIFVPRDSSKVEDITVLSILTKAMKIGRRGMNSYRLI